MLLLLLLPLLFPKNTEQYELVLTVYFTAFYALCNDFFISELIA